jgi:transcriptional regulator with XRE-family HTH domain
MLSMNVLPEQPINFLEVRKSLALTLRVVENETGISNAYLSQLERGLIVNPSYKIVVTLNNYYCKVSQRNAV